MGFFLRKEKKKLLYSINCVVYFRSFRLKYVVPLIRMDEKTKIVLGYDYW